MEVLHKFNIFNRQTWSSIEGKQLQSFFGVQSFQKSLSSKNVIQSDTTLTAIKSPA